MPGAAPARDEPIPIQRPNLLLLPRPTVEPVGNGEGNGDGSGCGWLAGPAGTGLSNLDRGSARAREVKRPTVVGDVPSASTAARVGAYPSFRLTRIFRTAGLSWFTEMTRIRPAHYGHPRGSSSYTLLFARDLARRHSRRKPSSGSDWFTCSSPDTDFRPERPTSTVFCIPWFVWLCHP